MTINRIILAGLYAFTIAALVYLVANGFGYYATGMELRPEHPLNELWKPSGLIGHGLGIVGSALMIIMMLYSVRKRFSFARRWGNIKIWLDYHIWMGVTGPLLVIFHTSFKLGGIVAVSFWSMIGVALSGVVGRYIYIQIPRSRTGNQLSASELDEMDREMMQKLAGYGVSEETLNSLQPADAPTKTGWGSVWTWFKEDLAMSSKLKKFSKELLAGEKVSHHQVHEAVKIVKQKLVLKRRIQFLHTAEGLLHYWHVIHKPFAIVMMVIMVVHVIVAVLFGYRWIWSQGA